MALESIDVKLKGLAVEVARIEGPSTRRPLVLLHEGLGSVGLWRGFPQQLHETTDREVLAYSRFGHGRSQPPPQPRTPAFFHEEALEVLPELLRQTGADDPILIGHSDGASIALIYAAHHEPTGAALMAPHVFVEEVTVAAIERTRERYREGELRERLARHHEDPEAAFWGWCDVWLDPAFRDWHLEGEARRLAGPTLLVQGVDDPYGSLEQLDRIERAAPLPIQRLHVPGGHSPHLEAAQETLQGIVDWQADLP